METALPIPFRQLYGDQKYKKYQWIEASVEKSTHDNRPETYRIKDLETLRTLGTPLSTKDNWSERKEVFLNKIHTFSSRTEIIHLAHKNQISLAAFKPSKYLDFKSEPVDREWNPKKLKALEDERQQLSLFDDPDTVEKDFQVVKKLPFKFSYRFEDCDGKQSQLMIEDWEIGALYRNCLKNSEGDEAIAVQKVREKYWEQFICSSQYDLTLILGTTLEHHNKKARNPFIIVGVVYPKKESQPKLF